VDAVAEIFVGFFVPAADDAGRVGDEQAPELGLDVVGKVMAGEDAGGGVASTSCRY
jgi:hypothetical protein